MITTLNYPVLIGVKQHYQHFHQGGDRNKNFPVKLAPGDTDSAYEKYNLKDHFLFKRSGTYNVKYFYHEYDGRAEVKIESNTLTIHIQLK
jgi:hypothetical protein